MDAASADLVLVNASLFVVVLAEVISFSVLVVCSMVKEGVDAVREKHNGNNDNIKGTIYTKVKGAMVAQ